MKCAPTPAFFQAKKRAFTLIELLIVVAIIGLLAAILFPAFNRVRALGRRTTCASNLKQIGIALEQYAQDYRSYPVMDAAGTMGSTGANPGGLLKDSHCGAWPDKVLPYLKSEKVFECPSNPSNRYQPGCPLPDYSDPDHVINFRGAYAFNMPNASYSCDAADACSTTLSFRQGASPVRYRRPSSTILVIDKTDQNGGGLGGFVSPGYTQPPPQDVTMLQNYGVPNRHEGGPNALFADGHVKWMSLDSLLKLGLWRINGPE